MDKMKATYETMLALVAEMVLDDAVLKFRTERIYRDIDLALASGDEDTFHRLAEQLNALRFSH
ncbi:MULTISPECIES: IDEAL domain-containing protein [Paenibacillus]|uniref:IDEAL domain-containing protein n=1 Tax=Paenibacillus curdlanolyticus YK9 TaxID=717606 RepID=E0IC65_9BACL|nr:MULTISPECIES: IDEAL domain-containing protein [Paenibacillus]EFM09751.1 conserved hypothetical protein [Paenibacillus curdlanolyticus YK9]MWC28486.1 IDEAL domain-containing protein [Paenibacillus sp. MMS18-CY102]